MYLPSQTPARRRSRPSRRYALAAWVTLLLAIGPVLPAAAAGGSGATVGDASGAKGMANDPNGAIRAMDRSSDGETGPHLMTTVPKLGPSRSDGAGASRTGGAPAGSKR